MPTRAPSSRRQRINRLQDMKDNFGIALLALLCAGFMLIYVWGTIIAWVLAVLCFLLAIPAYMGLTIFYKALVAAAEGPHADPSKVIALQQSMGIPLSAAEERTQEEFAIWRLKKQVRQWCEAAEKAAVAQATRGHIDAAADFRVAISQIRDRLDIDLTTDALRHAVSTVIAQQNADSAHGALFATLMRDIAPPTPAPRTENQSGDFCTSP